MIAFLISGNAVTFVSSTRTENVKPNIGIVENSFTGAAYRYQGFYDFYDKHGDELRRGEKITKDLESLVRKNSQIQFAISTFTS